MWQYGVVGFGTTQLLFEYSRVSQHTSQISHLLLYPSLWLLVLAIFAIASFTTYVLRSLLVSNILGNGYKILQASGTPEYMETTAPQFGFLSTSESCTCTICYVMQIF